MKTYELRVRTPVERVWEFHASVRAMEALTPPGRRVEILSGDVAVEEGALHRLRLRQYGIPFRWNARISGVRPPYEFTDTAERSPFAAWQHHHEFIPDGDGTIIRDTVRYIPPLGLLGWLANLLFISRDLDAVWAHRHDATRRALEG